MIFYLSFQAGTLEVGGGGAARGRGRGGEQTNQHILKIESDLLLMFEQELVLLQMVCLVKHCTCYLQGHEVLAAFLSYC